MKEGFLKPRLDLPKLQNRVPGIHRHKMSLDLSLVSAPNKNLTQLNFPTSRLSSLSVTRNHLTYLPVPVPVPVPEKKKTQTKSYKKYSTQAIDNLKNPSPASGLEALRIFNDALTEYELRELPSYSEVYFLGGQTCKIHGSLREPNWGYDDNDANYKVLIGDHLAYRYEILAILGKGSFGIVCKCLDHKRSETVAIKILKNKDKFHKQGNVEIQLLNTLSSQGSSPIINISGSFVFRYHTCIVFPLLHISLFEFMKRNSFRPFAMPVIKKLAVQLLTGLKIMQRSRIVHCDLKPENILFVSNKSIQVKIIDLGSGCYESQQIYTYIQSRFYRSPEVMLGHKYSPAIDIWSLGCILVELYTGVPLFPGKNEEDLMSRIVEVLGIPPKDLIDQAPRKLKFFDLFCLPLPYFDNKGHVRVAGSCSIKQILNDEEDFLDFIQSVIAWDPAQRLHPEQALIHAWLNK